MSRRSFSPCPSAFTALQFSLPTVGLSAAPVAPADWDLALARLSPGPLLLPLNTPIEPVTSVLRCQGDE